MNITKLVLLFLINIYFLPCTANAEDMYYGVLRGDKKLNFKAIVSGKVKIDNIHDGDIKNNVNLFNIDASINTLNMILMKKKEINLKKQILILQESLNISKHALKEGLVSMWELEEKEKNLREILIQLDEVKLQQEQLINIKDAASPTIKWLFIVRGIDVSDGQYITQVEPVISVETLHSFHIDIKIDPTTVKGNIKNKKIKYKSLVDGTNGYATIKKISSINDNTGANGMRMLTLELNSPKKEVYELLDTAFEVKIYDWYIY